MQEWGALKLVEYGHTKSPDVDFVSCLRVTKYFHMQSLALLMAGEQELCPGPPQTLRDSFLCPHGNHRLAGDLEDRFRDHLQNSSRQSLWCGLKTCLVFREGMD